MTGCGAYEYGAAFWPNLLLELRSHQILIRIKIHQFTDRHSRLRDQRRVRTRKGASFASPPWLLASPALPRRRRKPPAACAARSLRARSSCARPYAFRLAQQSRASSVPATGYKQIRLLFDLKDDLLYCNFSQILQRKGLETRGGLRVGAHFLTRAVVLVSKYGDFR